MLRWAELALFLVPFGLFLAWLLLARVSRGVTVAAVAVFVLIEAVTVYYGLHRSLRPGTDYVPARMEDGRIVPGHGQSP